MRSFTINTAKDKEYYDGKLFNEFQDTFGYDIVENDEIPTRHQG
jgi:hypothetical protein